MAEQQLPPAENSVKVRVNVGWFRRNKVFIFLVFAVIILFGALYGITYWGYHSSRLPYTFDNFVQGNGLWRVYGKKEYESVAVGDHFDLVDPRLKYVTDESVIGYTVQGAAVNFSKTETSLSDIELLLPDGERVEIPGTYEVERALTIQNSSESIYDREVYGPGTLEDLTQGSRIRVVFSRVYGEEWEISELFYISTEWGQETGPSVVPQTDPFLEEIYF